MRPQSGVKRASGRVCMAPPIDHEWNHPSTMHGATPRPCMVSPTDHAWCHPQTMHGRPRRPCILKPRLTVSRREYSKNSAGMKVMTRKSRGKRVKVDSLPLSSFGNNLDNLQEQHLFSRRATARRSENLARLRPDRKSCFYSCHGCFLFNLMRLILIYIPSPSAGGGLATWSGNMLYFARSSNQPHIRGMK